MILTLGAMMLFGVNISLLVYRSRKFGFTLHSSGGGGAAGTGLGSLVGIAASACPVCGSLLLSAIGIAGAMAFVFGLSELKLLTLRLPFMAKVLPTRLQKSGDYSKSFFLGLFLGNAGVGCPNPAFYVLLTYIATLGNIGDGVLLGVIHGLGRATPLIFLTILAILGINSLDWVGRSQAKVERAMGWGLVGIGAYLFQYLPFKMAFWEESIFHVVYAHEEGATRVTPDNTLGPFLAFAIIILAIVTAKRIKRRRPVYD